MTLETFFEKFNQFADAPNAVARMRELVLHLAVTGKLVAQVHCDESGELLLKKIHAERLAAVKARQISPMKPLGAAGADDLSFKLPPGWAAAHLVELVLEIQTGPFGSSVHKSDYQHGGIPVINPASLKNGQIVPMEEMAIGRATLKRLEVFKLRVGDIVLARRGEMGRCAIVTKREEGWLCGTGSLVLRIPRSVYGPYLATLIGAPIARAYLGGASVGTTMQNLNQSILAKMPVGVPPIEEQKRIVTKVNELMALCDLLEAQQQERETRRALLARAALARFSDAPTPANLQFLFHPSNAVSPADLRKTILALAVQGKLVPQDPNDQPAANLLALMARDRAGLASEHGVRPPKDVSPISVDDHPHDIPDSWEWSRIGQLALVIDYGTSQKAHNNTPGVPVYRMGNIVGGRVVNENLKYVDERIDDLPGLYLNTDDILFNRTNSYELVGKTGIYTGADKAATFASYLIRIRLPKTFVFPPFYAIAMNAPYYRETQIEPDVVQQCGQANFNGTKLASTVVPTPPLNEQRRIVAKVDELMAMVDQLEAQLTASRAAAARLLEAAVNELTAPQ